MHSLLEIMDDHGETKNEMFAVGHIAIGYITGAILGKVTGQNPGIPFLWTMSLLPDLDFLIPGIIHRYQTHSIILAMIIFAPFLLYIPRKVAPYFAALITHFSVDYLTNGGVMLLWPLSSDMMKHDTLFMMGGRTESHIELALFGIMILMLIASNDFKKLSKTEVSNILLFVPLCTIVIPAMYRYPVEIPGTLLIAYLMLFGIIALSITWSLYQTLKRVM